MHNFGDSTNVTIPRTSSSEPEAKSSPVSRRKTGGSVGSVSRVGASGIFGRVTSFFGGGHRGGRHGGTSPKGTPARIVGVIVVVAAIVLGGVGVSSMLAPNEETLMTQVFVGDDDCVDYIQLANEKLGSGENQIDASYNGHGVGIYATREFDLRHDKTPSGHLTSPYGFPNGTSQRVVQDAWVDAGCKYDEAGFCRLNDCYLIACTSVFGEVGDHITFYFDDGSSIECVKIDAKAEQEAWYDHNPATKWGHDDGRCVLEFCGQDRIGDNPYTTLGKVGRHTTSWTNHGKAVDIGGAMGGAASGATSAAGRAKNGTAASALADCEAKQKFDNSTLAAALVSYSYSQRRLQADSETSTALYQEVCTAVFSSGDITASYHFHSCDRGVAAAVHWTGADINFPAGAPSDQFTYCKDSPLWEVVSTAQDVVITGDEDWAEAHGLQPGDVGITMDDHILAYVGHDAVQQGYDNFIKGNNGQTPGTGGDIGEPDPDACWVSASAHQRGANIGTQGSSDSRTYTFFRYKGDYPDADKYKDVGSKVTLGLKGANKGTACECAEPEEEDTCGEMAAKKALELSHSAVDDGVDYNALIAEAGLSDRYEYRGGNIYNIYPAKNDRRGTWGYDEPMPMELESVGINMAFERWQEGVCIPGGYQNGGWYACCSPWVTGVLRELELDSGMPVAALNQEGYARLHPETFEVIPLDFTKTWDEQCKPGDILNCAGHTAMYVGNDLAQKAFPGTTGNVCEAGQNSRRNLGVTLYDGKPGGGWRESSLDDPESQYYGVVSGEGSGVIIRVKCPDDMSTDGLLDDGPMSGTQQSVISAARSTGSPGSGLCAMWVSMVFSNAGLGYPSGNACDMYWAWCHSSNKSDLKPGMIVAVDTHPHTSAGSTYGHVGIYMGNGMVRDNIGYIRDIGLDEWISYYGATHPVKWGWVDGHSLA